MFKGSKGMKQVELTNCLQEYILEHGFHEHTVLKDLRDRTSRMSQGKNQITPQQASIMAFVISLLKPKKILELGVFTGYSALCMAIAAPKAFITAVDKNNQWTRIAEKYWQAAKVDKRIQLIIQDATQFLNKNQDKFDLIFVDADKKNTPFYVNKCLSKLNEGGVLIIDNVLQEGRVLGVENQDFSTLQQENANIMHKVNQMIYNLDQNNWHHTMIGIGDGFSMVHKLKA